MGKDGGDGHGGDSEEAASGTRWIWMQDGKGLVSIWFERVNFFWGTCCK